MNRVVLFPYNPHAEVILRNRHSLKEFQVEFVCMIREDAHLIQHCINIYSVNATTDFRTAISECDGLVLVEPTFDMLRSAYLELVYFARLHNKFVLCTKQVADWLNIDCLLDESFCFAHENIEKRKYVQNMQLIQPSAPIITISGLGENCSKFETQIQLNAYLQKLGYSVLSVSSNKLGRMFGMETIPKEFFSELYSFEEQIFRFNQFICNLCELKKPDIIIIISLPGGVVPLNDESNNHFSNLALVISNAVQTDIGIMNLYFTLQYDDKFLSKIEQCLLYKYNIPIAGMFLTRQRLQFDIEKKKFFYNYLSREFCQNFSNVQMPAQLYNFSNKDERETLFHKVIQTLEENPSII